MLRLEDFLWGFGFGVVCTVVAGWLWAVYRGWVRDRDAFRRPLSGSQPSGKTPEQIYRDFVRAESKIWLARIAFVVIVWLLLELLLPATADQVRMWLVDLVRWVIRSQRIGVLS